MDGTTIHNFRCTSACYYITRGNIQLDKEFNEECRGWCWEGGRKSYWDVEFTDAGLPGDNTKLIDDSNTQCSAVRENPTMQCC